METFRVSVYGADPRHGAKPCREYRVAAASGSEATKWAMDKLERENSRWWAEIDAQRDEP
ncbi:hypothetical protein [Candidatus Binatus sp.]|jgi:hypothetical protein|uniref:hypothetical protein n=1 Tax=Candidatus Binatus sp. TaxID=2811406 RepID=UPI003BDE6713